MRAWHGPAASPGTGKPNAPRTRPAPTETRESCVRRVPQRVIPGSEGFSDDHDSLGYARQAGATFSRVCHRSHPFPQREGRDHPATRTWPETGRIRCCGRRACLASRSVGTGIRPNLLQVPQTRGALCRDGNNRKRSGGLAVHPLRLRRPDLALAGIVLGSQPARAGELTRRRGQAGQPDQVRPTLLLPLHSCPAFMHVISMACRQEKRACNFRARWLWHR
jgi:hypothetical protein